LLSLSLSFSLSQSVAYLAVCRDHDPNARPEFAQICTELQSCINLISVTNVLRGDISAAAKVVAIFDKVLFSLCLFFSLILITAIQMDPLPWNTFALQMVTLYPRLQPDSLEQLKTCGTSPPPPLCTWLALTARRSQRGPGGAA
jgi:hypothetical protein